MKRIVAAILLIGITTSVLALQKTDLERRVSKLVAKFEALQANPEKAIPADKLRKARGIVLLDRTKAGFIFAYQGGGGIVMVKDARTDKWGPFAFLEANEASLGFQIGGEQVFYAILLMDTNATRNVTDAKINFAGEARGTAGNESAGEEGKFTPPEHPVLVYTDRAGLYGGAALKGGAISADDEANTAYYGEYFTARDILFANLVVPSESAVKLAGKLAEYSKSDGK